jgi:outer membrane receptor for ferrienterochelin and colicin
VTSAGYVSKTVAVVAGEKPQILVSLVPELRFQERMDIEASAQSATTAPAPLAVRPVQVLAAAGAVDNVFRVLQALPGVTATNEFTSHISVRGGGPDENLTVMDGVEIANPYRLQGLVSAFNPETIESFSLDTGSFGVARGDRLSSLLVVQNRAGTDAKAIAGSAALSITDGNVVVEGKLPGAKGSWIVTGRRTYYDLVAARIIDTELPSFTDLQTRIVWAPSSGTRLSIFGVRSREHADATFDDEATDDYGEFLAASRNDLVAVTFDARIGQRANSRTIASWYDNTGSFDVSAQFQDKSLRSNAPDDTGFGREDIAFGYDLAVRDLAFREELVFRPSARHLLQAGAETHRLTTAISWQIKRGQDAADGSRQGILPSVLDSSVASGRSGAWLQDRVTLGRRLAVEAGLRFDRSEVNGRSDLSPRLAATLTLDDATRLRGAVGKYTQSPGYDKLVQSDFFVDLSHTGTLDLPNERSLHGSLALERDLGPGIEARAEVYYKSFRDLIVGRLEGEAERAARVAQYDFPAELAQDVPASAQITSTPVGDGRGRAYGFDLYLAKRPLSNDTRLAGWASYTYGVASRDTYGRRYAFDYDRRHALSVVETYRVLNWLEVATTLRVASGFPTTPVVGIRVAATADALDQDGDGNTTELVPQRDPAGNLVYTPHRGGVADLNSTRLPLFARLDLRLSFRPGGRNGRWLIYLDVINVLNRKNVASLDRELAYDPVSDRPMLVEREGGSLPRFPSFGVRFRF